MFRRLPDETVQVYIEVYDNDTISGPKKGVSQTLTLKIHSREQEHQNLEQLQEEVAAAVQMVITTRGSDPYPAELTKLLPVIQKKFAVLGPMATLAIPHMNASYGKALASSTVALRSQLDAQLAVLQSSRVSLA